MSNCIIPRRPSRWSAAQMVVVALLGTLAAVAVVAVCVMIMAPPNIYFSIHEASLQMNADGYATYYNFTLVANNTGRRMGVRYGATRTEIWYSGTEWVLAELNAEGLPGSGEKPQPPMGSSSVRGWAEYYKYQVTNNPRMTAENISWPNCKVVVAAKVSFTYVVFPTRPYNVRVACHGVDFKDTTAYADCTA